MPPTQPRQQQLAHRWKQSSVEGEYYLFGIDCLNCGFKHTVEFHNTNNRHVSEEEAMEKLKARLKERNSG